MDSFKVSEIQIIPIKPRNGLVAFASCVLYESLYIGNIAIHISPTNEYGYRLVYPAKTLPNGKEINCVHPINREMGSAITVSIVNKYIEILSKGGASVA